MATKKKSAVGSGQGAVNAGPPPVDLVELPRELESTIEDYTGWNSAYSKQSEVITELELKLADAKAYLATLAEPLLRIRALLDPEKLKAIAAAKPYDAALKAKIGNLELTKDDYGKARKNGKWQQKSTGAMKWSELAASGATDEQIKTNLKHVRSGYSSKAGYCFEGGSLKKRLKEYGNSTTVCSGKDLIAAVRRLYKIGPPIKAEKPAAAAVKKKAATKPKSSTKSAKPDKKAAPARKKPAAKAPKSSKASANGKHATNGHVSQKSKKRNTSGERVAVRNTLAVPGDENGELFDGGLDLNVGVRKCCLCGCTEASACVGDDDQPCHWVEHPVDPTKDLCSACLPLAQRQASNFADPPGKRSPSSTAPINGLGDLGDRDEVPLYVRNQRAAAIPTLTKMQLSLLREVVASYPSQIGTSRAAEFAGYKPGGKVSAAWRELDRLDLIRTFARGVVIATAKHELPPAVEAPAGAAV